MYRHILAPIALEHDGKADKAVAVARQLADDGATITIIHVAEEVPTYIAAEIPQTVLAGKQQEIQDELARLAATVEGAAKTAVLHGHAGRAIVDYAMREGVDCIVVASHRPELADYLLGSTAARVVRHAACSVHVIR